MAKPNNFDGFCWFVVTNYDFVILKKLNLTAPLKKKHFLLHPQLDPILKFYCYFNSLVLPNMMRWTWFDLLIISGVKFWWFSLFYFRWSKVVWDGPEIVSLSKRLQQSPEWFNMSKMLKWEEIHILHLHSLSTKSVKKNVRPSSLLFDPKIFLVLSVF